jgi:hypothetical protein
VVVVTVVVAVAVAAPCPCWTWYPRFADVWVFGNAERTLSEKYHRNGIVASLGSPEAPTKIRLIFVFRLLVP